MVPRHGYKVLTPALSSTSLHTLFASAQASYPTLIVNMLEGLKWSKIDVCNAPRV